MRGLSSAPVTISATGSHGSIGGADVSAFLPPTAPPPGGDPGTTGGGGGGSTGAAPTGGGSAQPPAPPTFSLPAKVALKATGLNVGVTVSGAGKVTLTATVPAKAMGRKGKPVTIGTGRANVQSAGRVTVKLRLTAAAKKRPEEAQGAKMTLRIQHDGRTSTRTVKLR